MCTKHTKFHSLKASLGVWSVFIFLILHASSSNLVAQKTDHSFFINKNLSIFNTVMRELDLFYVDTLDYDKITKNSIDYMLRNLDPYTVYMPEEDADDISMMTRGEYGGIGSIVTKNGDNVCISEPYEGMPAQKNGLKAGDIILEVDGKSTKDLSVNDVSSMLRGTPSTQIQIKVKRSGENKPIEKTFLREKIQMHPIAYSAVVGPKIGYVLLNDFTDKAALELKAAVNDMIKSDGIESLIIDVRSNGGGLIDEAVKILGFFVPKGTEVVSTKGRIRQTERAYMTPTEPIFPNMKLAVLTNRGSASASEILAGAIQDLDRGVVIGERTFGKGLVQNIRPVGYGGHLKVTTAKYYIPSGRCIQAIDYSHRNDDGSVGPVPDSLTNVFYTKNGRPVRDGGGIVPDTLTSDEKTMNVAYYIYLQNHYFNFANEYVLTHESIPPASQFELSDEDFNAFTNYLTEKNFTYTTQTEKYFKDLEEIAEYEGLTEQASAEIEALKKKLVPNVSQDIQNNKKDIVDLLSIEIIKRYYYQKGEVEYTLRNDVDLETALSILKSNDKYTGMLSGK